MLLRSVHCLLATTERRHFVPFGCQASIWSFGRQAFRVGAAYVRRAALVAPAMPALRALRDMIRGTIGIGAPDDGRVVILVQVESRGVVRAINIVGCRSPLSSGGLSGPIATQDSFEAGSRHLT